MNTPIHSHLHTASKGYPSVTSYCKLAFVLAASIFLFYGTSLLGQSSVQSQRGNGPFVGRVRAIVSLKSALYALITDAPSYISGVQTIPQIGIYKSTNNGGSWTRLSSFPTSDLPSTLGVHLNSLYITTGGSGILYKSNDEGMTWLPASQAIMGSISHLVSFNDTLFARTGSTRISSMFQSTDSGKTWSLVGSPGAILTIVAAQGRTAATRARTMLFGGFVPSMSSLLRSLDGGQRWDEVTVMPSQSDLLLYNVAVKSNDELFLATNKGVLFSQNNGLNWQILNQGIEGKTVFDIAINDSILYAATNDGLYMRNGQRWEAIPISLTSAIVQGIQVETIHYVENQSSILIGTTKGIFRGTILPNGSIGAWEQLNRGLPGVKIEAQALAIAGTLFGTTPILAAQTDGVYRAQDGASWLASNNGLGSSPFASRIASVGQPPISLIASKSGAFVTALSSIDAGQSWRGTNLALVNDEILCFGSASGNSIITGTKNGSLFRASASTPQFWSKILFNPLEGTNTAITAFAQSATILFASSANGLMQSIDGGNTWTRLADSIFPHLNVTSLAASGTTVLAGTDQGVYISENNGRTWITPRANTQVNTQAEGQFVFVQSLLIRDGLFYAGTASNGVFRSTDNGSTWVKLAINGLVSANSMAADTGRVFIGSNNGIYEMALPRPDEFPIITRLLPSDSLIIGLGDTHITIQGVNFTSSTRVVFDGRELQRRLSGANEISITIPSNFITSLGAKSLELINSVTARATTTLKVVPLPQNFPRITVTNSLEPFVSFFTQVSTTQTYTLQGFNISDSLIISVPEGFDISLDGGRTWVSGRIAVQYQTQSPTQQVSVRYRPTSLRVSNTQISHIVGGFVLQTLALNASPRSLQIITEPATLLQFGSTKIGQTLRRTIILTNPNTVSITLATVISGAASNEYALSQRQIIIPPSGTASIDVSFTPMRRGERTAQLEILGAAAVEISLSGKGAQAVFDISPNNIIFSTAAYIGQSIGLPRESITVQNTGDSADEILNTVLLGASNSFRLIGTTRKVLEPGESYPMLVEAKPNATGINEAILSVATADRFSSSANVNIRVQGRVLEPPQIVSPSIGSVVPVGNVQLNWLESPTATHYELALENVANASRLLSGNHRILSTTAIALTLPQNTSFYWTVRALVIRGQDTITKSVWQRWQFFSTGADSRLSLQPILDFGTVTMQQIETPPRSLALRVNVGVWRVSEIAFIQEPDNADGDFSAFRVGNRSLYTLDGGILKPLSESYPIAVSFRPPRLRNTPYLALGELRLQNVTTNEVLVLPFQARAIATNCPQAPSAIASGNSGCPETVLALQLIPKKAVYAPGDDVRLQILLSNSQNSSPSLDQYFRRLSVEIDVQNISLLAFNERLSVGTGTDGANSVRVIPYSTLESLQSSLPVNPNGKIRIAVERSPNVQSGVLAEIQGKAVIGFKGIAVDPEQSLESVLMRFADVQWQSDGGNILDSGQVIVWGDSQQIPLNQQVITATVNTCLVNTDGSLFIAKTFPLQVEQISPNPVLETAVVTFSLQNQSHTELLLFNVYGQVAKTVVSTEMLPGKYSIPVSVRELPSGTYFLVLKTPLESTHAKVEVLR